MGYNEKTPKPYWYYRWRPLIFFPYSTFLIVFPQVLHLARVGVTTGSMRRYLNHTKFAQAVQLLQDGISIVPLSEGLLCLPAQSQEHGGDSRRQAVTLGELDRAIEGP